MHKISTVAAGALIVMLCALFAFTASAQTYPIGNPLNDDNTSLQNNSTNTMNDTNTTTNSSNSAADMNNNATNTSTSTSGTSTSSTTSGTSTPGVPNTGVGGDSAGTWLLLILSGMLAVGGISYMLTAPRSLRS